jgi:hypothetical protein
VIRLLVLTQTEGPDYLSDLVLQGLFLAAGINIFTDYLPPYLAKSFPDLSSIYGRGFTAFGNLSDSQIRDKLSLQCSLEIQENITSRNYHYILYLSIQRRTDYLEHVLRYYHPSEIIALDGEDNTRLHSELTNLTTYFKRELTTPDSSVHPISFAIPDAKLQPLSTPKSYLVAPCDPRDRNTYSYHTEQAYYQQYQESYFAITMKKGGWDCLRHYEIIMNGCLPYFIDISHKPSRTMANYPLALQYRANKLFFQFLSSPHERSSLIHDYLTLRSEFLQWLTSSSTVSCYWPYLLKVCLSCA